MNKSVMNKNEQNEIDKQRKVVNESYAAIHRQTLQTSLRTLNKLVEKKTCGTR